MRILHVIESLEVGGAETLVVQLGRVQLQSGYRVSVACLFSEGKLAESARAAGLAVSTMGKQPGMDLRAVRRLRSTIRSDAPDVVHTHGPVSHYYAVAAAVGLGVRTVVNTRHGLGEKKSFRLRLLYRLAMMRTTISVAVCEAARKQLIADGWVTPRQIVTVTNGIDLSRLETRSPARRAEVVAELGLPENAFIIGTVGRLAPMKDQALLIRALKLLHDNGYDRARLLIIGDGEQRQSLIRLCNELGVTGVVRFLGTRSDVPRILAALDAFALPSRSEGFSLSLVEALATGVPSIAMNVGGNPEVLGLVPNGLLVKIGDVNCLAQALGTVMGDERSIGMGGAGMLKSVSIECMRDRYHRIYLSGTL